MDYGLEKGQARFQPRGDFDALRLETGGLHWQRPVLPPLQSGEDEAFWRGLEQKLRRP